MKTLIALALAAFLWTDALAQTTGPTVSFRWLDRDGDGVNDLEPRHGDIDGDGRCDQILSELAPQVAPQTAPKPLGLSATPARPSASRRLDFFIDEDGDGIKDGRVLPLGPRLGQGPAPRLLLLRRRQGNVRPLPDLRRPPRLAPTRPSPQRPQRHQERLH